MSSSEQDYEKMTPKEKEQHDKLQKEKEEAEQAQLPYKYVHSRAINLIMTMTANLFAAGGNKLSRTWISQFPCQPERGERGWMLS
jgi:hypothetical protein